MSIKQAQIISILGVLLAVLVGGYLLGIPLEREEDVSDVYDTYMVDTIDALYSYENNTHDYSGVIMLPNPCYSLTSEAIVRESYPEQVTFTFTTTAPDEDVMCAQVIKEESFRIIFSASGEAVVDATFNGRPVTLVVADYPAESAAEDLENITIEEIN